MAETRDRSVYDSIEPVKVIGLHEQKFVMFADASDEDLIQMWSTVNSLDSSLEYSRVYRQASLKKLAQLDGFLNTAVIYVAILFV